MAIIILLTMLSLLSPPEVAEETLIEPEVEYNFFQPVIDKLYTLGVDSMFVYKLSNDPRVKFDQKYSKIHVPTGKSSGSSNKYATHYNRTAVSKTKAFLNVNMDLLSTAEKQFGVNKEILAALLYVETRHGNYLGNHNVASVYMSLAMADQPDLITMNLNALKAKHSRKSKEAFAKLESKLMKRVEQKTTWAIEQLIALDSMDSCCYDALSIHGSYAGAFGISQFIPDSYVRWAIDGNNDGKVDLFILEDAVFSAANYLKLHGWTDDPQDQYDAIWGYNHSNAYVKAIQKLAGKIK